MPNLTMTRDEIHLALALEYGAEQATYENLQSKAWQALKEEGDADGYRFNMRAAENASHHLDGIRVAAEALGITKEELVKAAQIARIERRLV